MLKFRNKFIFPKSIFANNLKYQDHLERRSGGTQLEGLFGPPNSNLPRQTLLKIINNLYCGLGSRLGSRTGLVDMSTKPLRAGILFGVRAEVQ